MTIENEETRDRRGIAAVVDIIARWARLCRVALGARNELAAASPAEVSRIARDLGVRD
jgi:hypothetical protein